MNPEKPCLSLSQAKGLREKALEASHKRAEATLDLGRILWETYYADVKVGSEYVPVWQAWEFKTWNDYVEEELGFHMTTAAFYRRIHEVFGIELADKWDRSLVASYTKMKALTRVVDAKNVNGWLRKAAKLSCCDLENEVHYALTGKNRPKNMRSFLASVTKDELEILREVIELGREDLGVERRGEVLAEIARQWKSSRNKVKRTLRRVA